MLSRRKFLGHSAFGIGSLAVSGLSTSMLSTPALAKIKDELTIYGPPAGPSIALAHLAQSGALQDHVGKVQFKVWRTPDQLRAGVLDGSMSITGTPTYVAANLYNRGINVRLSSVVTWGLLYLMSREGKVASLAAVRGKTIVMPYKNDMPDLVFRAMASKIGLKQGRDYKLQYVGTPMQAMKMMIAGDAKMAVLPEPAATGAQMQGMKNGIEVTRALDLQKAWGSVFGGRSAIPQAGMMISGKLLTEQPELVSAFNNALVESGRWVSNNPTSAAKIGAAYLGLKAPIIERSIPFSHIDVKSGKQSKAELEKFFVVLKGMSPAIIGGKLPAGTFYQ
ncbi:NitT/TauT family transport system substrate-binding protein [Cohaesibacter marisflavi]|uniref:NitT/TauT family transport system substrate-binding protein n=1 Tax=Cohaesibacter marisflavi TaxID=655353 RepID=A0A1I5M8Z6_9HYPH|nr:twin-arginine translocation signal domain-containing protein [Cohaesibacter marisflavi]SFP05963.1 NitT/TauT family transport system substrate-binding protein [Cohaesibacter marisflavi]